MPNDTKEAFEQTLVILDCETCSLAGGIIEIGLISFDTLEDLLKVSEEDFRERSLFSRHENPIPIDAGAFAVHGISEKDVKGLPRYSASMDFYEKVKDFPAEQIVLIGHNVISFDQKRLDLSDFHPAIDTLNLVRLLIKEEKLTHEGGNKLDFLVSIYCSKEQAHLKQFHGAIGDNWKVVVFLKYLLEIHLKGATVEELCFLSAKATPAQKTRVLAAIASRL